MSIIKILEQLADNAHHTSIFNELQTLIFNEAFIKHDNEAIKSQLLNNRNEILADSDEVAIF
ncbi:MAG: hypothetical protein JO149_04445 [Gammaproteobacteria bacterium]|nr:hypothetical protein [Gammaproteobacteria bacterium]